MSCYSEGLIQQYIDGEMPLEQAHKFELHIKTCSKCNKLKEEVKLRAERMKFEMKILDSNTKIIIPEFKPPCSIKHNIINIKQLIFNISAASIIVFMVLFTSRLNSDHTTKYSQYQIIDFEIDANQPITNQEMVIHFINSDGFNDNYMYE